MKLKLNETYIYYDFPILFSALDEGGNAFICLFAEETDSHLRYICVQISQSAFMELEHNQRDIRSLFVHSEKVFNLFLNAESEEPVEVVETQEDITPFIPEKDLFIGKIQEEIAQSVILDEIDAMTHKEYRVLSNKALKYWEPIFIPVVPGGDIFNSNISFSINYKVTLESLYNNNYFEGDIICLQAA
jgi:hypothetical protein